MEIKNRFILKKNDVSALKLAESKYYYEEHWYKSSINNGWSYNIGKAPHIADHWWYEMCKWFDILFKKRKREVELWKSL